MAWRSLAAALLLGLARPGAAAPDAREDAFLRAHLWGQVRALPKGRRPVVGLVLSAGAVRGMAHIGVLQVLENADFPVDVVAGTSMGAVVGSLYASGIGMDALREIPRDLRLSSGSNYSRVRLLGLLLSESLLSTENLEDVLKEKIGDLRFDQIGKPFACVAMDIRTGERIIFREGPLAPAVRSSMNLPGIFKPVLYRHRYLVDGGVVDYVPVDAARLLGADWVIASVTEGDFSRALPGSVLSTLQQVIDIRGAILSRQQRNEADMVIEPAVGELEYYDVERAKEAMTAGIVAARAGLDEAKDRLILKALPQILASWPAR
ncbi:MAG TPA: patatin-like phospholipase family protein [Elusimicrobiota bacterium]|nr:patatin-like phospholipase family protein [Elusimicrobiota bacterium]